MAGPELGLMLLTRTLSWYWKRDPPELKSCIFRDTSTATDDASTDAGVAHDSTPKSAASVAVTTCPPKAHTYCVPLS